MEIFRFIKWLLSSFELWRWAFILSMILTLGSILAPEPWNSYMNGLGLGIIFFFFAKWAVWDGTRRAWQLYKEDRNKLLSTIRDSDK